MESRKKIDSTMAFFMISFAAMVDFVQMIVGFIALIPLVGIILAVLFSAFISISVWLIFAIWFGLLGVRFFGNSGKRAGIWFAGALAEMTPLGFLPIWTATITAIIVTNSKS